MLLESSFWSPVAFEKRCYLIRFCCHLLALVNGWICRFMKVEELVTYPNYELFLARTSLQQELNKDF